jgi:carboxylate-amine ligase
LLALSANSPYWNRFDTGLQAARAKIFEGLPNTGVPTAFEDFEAFQRFERTMVETGSIHDRGELWFDVRPHSEHGTVEIRVPDGQADPDRVLAFVEYAQALVEDLGERYEDGEAGREHRRELLDENKWRAIRHGHDAELLSRDFSDTVPLGELVDRERSRLGVSGIADIYEAGSGAERQRRICEEDCLDALCESLVIG